MKYLLVGGTFDREEGRTSGYLKKVHEYLSLLVDPMDITVYNGGNISTLHELVEHAVELASVVIWFPKLDNSESKLVGHVKKNNPTCMLVASKFNDGKYEDIDVVARALQVKANLIVEFSKPNSLFESKILDPLGNIFYQGSDIAQLTIKMIKRVVELRNFTRIPSMRVQPYFEAANEPEFFDIATDYADVFHTLIHGVHPTRFMGNLSFRCTHGFPSFRAKNDRIYVSKRNIDKREINSSSFAPVELGGPADRVSYYGNDKPSVDTPIQTRLYKYYTNINYMIHSHVYIKTDLYTERMIPCGAIEEFTDIIDVVPNRKVNKFFINLKGHGSIAFGRTVDDLRNIEYDGRF